MCSLNIPRTRFIHIKCQGQGQSCCTDISHFKMIHIWEINQLRQVFNKTKYSSAGPVTKSNLFQDLWMIAWTRYLFSSFLIAVPFLPPSSRRSESRLRGPYSLYDHCDNHSSGGLSLSQKARYVRYKQPIHKPSRVHMRFASNDSFKHGLTKHCSTATPTECKLGVYVSHTYTVCLVSHNFHMNLFLLPNLGKMPFVVHIQRI